jgi:capsular exopolysaccharide synthesis family protein
VERIKQAVERARRERQKVVADDLLDRPPETAETEPDEDIGLTQTRQIEVPRVLLERNRILTGIERNEVAHAYKALRTHVLQGLRGNNWKSLVVTSPGENAGKTVTAINLAISLARDVNHTVLLLDLDLRRPSVHKYLGFTPEAGLSDYVNGNAEISDLLVSPGIERLTVLPGHKSVDHSSEMLSSPRIVRLIKEMKSRYRERIIVIDMPPLLMTDDVLAFSPNVDAALLVVEAGGTPKDDITRSIELLGGTNLLGTVLNKSRSGGRAYY